MATRPYAVESRARSWWHLISTFAVLGGAFAIAAFAPWWPVRILGAVLMALTMTRAFIILHDVHHGALFKDSKVANAIMNAYGLVLMTPRRVWRHTHNYHHAHTAKTTGAQLGSPLLWTTAQWDEASRMERFVYRLERHPLTIAFGYITVFMLNFALIPFLRSPRRFWDSGLSFLVHVACGVLVYALGGWDMLLFAYLLPFLLAGAFGSYLFYVQHNFDGMQVPDQAEWNHTDASLEASSYLKCGPIMRWFTGNIGYHHVHHLNLRIPFYRLPEAMDGIPELGEPPTVTLNPRTVVDSFRLKIWDPEQQQMVGYP